MESLALASGSSGNCFYAGTKSEAVLIDVGISAKQITQRLVSMGLSMDNVKALFITHEHIDHVRGADVLARQYNLPIYATKKTAQNCFICSNESQIQTIKNTETIHFKTLSVEAFSKSHHAAEPVSYTISSGKKRISVITDAGHACKNIKSHVKDADLLYLEANHDLHMLENGPYPFYLKKLIKSDVGHLSNAQASLCMLEFSPSRLQAVVLSHLSRTNNLPQVAHSEFLSVLKERKDLEPQVHISLREIPTPIFSI